MSHQLCKRFKQVMLVSTIFVSLIFNVAAGSKQAKYIFLMIGDGMGTTQRKVAEAYKRNKLMLKPEDKAGKLVMNTFPVVGDTDTSSYKAYTTDSAAAGTALACGVKTKNGVVNMTPDLKRKLKPISYDALAKGMRVGIISSVNLDHATPACFYASAITRGDKYNIAMQMATSNINYFAGSHFARHNPLGKGVSSLKAAKDAGYKIVQDKAAFNKLKPKDNKVIVEVGINYKIDEQTNGFQLAELVKTGIELLDNPNGFFIMVEGGKIDWCGHANDLATNVKEVLAFDDAVAVAYDFYKKHPNETLIIVTGDHETGGLKFIDDGFKPSKLVKAVDGQKMSASKFGKKINDWRMKKISTRDAIKELTEDFGLHNLSPSEKKELSDAVAFVLSNKQNDKRSEAYRKMYGNKNPAIIVALNLVAKRCGIKWGTFSHTGVPVQTTAIGVNASDFKGKTDNTDIYKKLLAIIKQQ